MKFYGMVKDNKFNPDNRDAFTEAFQKLNDKFICVEVQEQIRSNALNSYYWAVVVKLFSEHLGYDREEMHEILKFKFLREYKVNAKFDLEIVKVKRSRKLTNKEFQEYLENCRMWGAKLEIDIPLPNE